MDRVDPRQEKTLSRRMVIGKSDEALPKRDKIA